LRRTCCGRGGYISVVSEPTIKKISVGEKEIEGKS